MSPSWRHFIQRLLLSLVLVSFPLVAAPVADPATQFAPNSANVGAADMTEFPSLELVVLVGVVLLALVVIARSGKAP